MADTDDLDIKAVRSWREFEEELAQLGEDLRAIIEVECEGFPVDIAASKARRDQAIFDYEFFCRTYFPHYVPTSHFSLFQQFIFKRLPERIDAETDAREVHLAPRGEAKSTYETQLGSLWCICRSTYIQAQIIAGKLPKKARKHMIGIVMNTEEQAAEMLESIKAELIANPRLAMDFPDAVGEGKKWQSREIVTVNNIKLRIGGTAKKLRGMKHGPYRPDLMFLDDLENDENVKSPEQREKIENLVTSSVVGLQSSQGGMDIFFVGTSLHYNAAIHRVGDKPGWRKRTFKAIVRFPDNMKLWETWEGIYSRPGNAEEKEEAEAEARAFYEANKEEMEAGAIVSWPGVRGLYRLMCMRASDHKAFNQEYQNEAGNDEDAAFKTFHFWVDRRKDWIFFGGLDPSLGKKGKKGDYSAIIIGGWNRVSMQMDVVEADIQRRRPDVIIANAIEWQKEYACLMWAVESVAFQEILCEDLIKSAAIAGVFFPVPPEGGVPAGREKDLAIMSLQIPLSRGNIRLHHSQHLLLEQLKFYGEAKHDDGPDALEMCWNIARNFAQEFAYHSAASHRGREHDEDDTDWDEY